MTCNWYMSSGNGTGCNVYGYGGKKVKDLKKGIIPIYKPGLEELVLKNHKEGRLNFSIDAKAGVKFATAIFSAVGTPPDENHRADLRFVKIVAKTVGEKMNKYKVFINKSTVLVLNLRNL